MPVSAVESTKCSSLPKWTSGRPSKRVASASRTFRFPSKREPHGALPLGISRTQSSEKNAMMRSRSCALKAAHSSVSVNRISIAQSPLQIEHGDGADWRSCAVAPLRRQADEGELTLAEQRFQIAQALDVGDVEVETRLVHERVHLALGPGPHRVDAEMHDALARQPFGGSDIHAGIVGRIFLARERAFVMAGAEQNGATLRHAHAGFLHGPFEI